MDDRLVTTRNAWLKYHLAVWVGYLLLAVLLTWPTVTHPLTFLPGDGGDDPAIAWNLWWVKYSLLNQPQNPFFSRFMFYPIGINLAFYTLTLLNGFTALPWLLNWGVVAASNLHLWFSLALGGYGTFLLVLAALKQMPDRSATVRGATVAGAMVAFASNRLFYVALGQFNIAGSHWIPFVVLFFIKMHRHPDQLRWSGLCALFLVLQTYTEMTYTTFLLVFMACYWLYFLLVDQHRKIIGWLYLRSAGLLALLAALGIAPLLAAMLPDMLAEGDFMVVGGGFAHAFSADLLGFFIPTMHHPVWGQLIRETGIGQNGLGGFDKGQHIYVGYVLPILAAVGFWYCRRDRAVWFWLMAGVLFAWLCLGPQVLINGHNTGIPGPFVVLQQLPFFKGNRYPSRYSVMLLLSLGIPAGWGIAALSGRMKIGLPVAGLILLLFMAEHLSIPLPQSDMTVPPVYRQIAADTGDFAVLDIPFAWRNGFRITGAYTTGFMMGQFYQTVHQKWLLQGNTSRNPEFKFQYFTNVPVVNTLRLLETGHPLTPQQWQADVPIAAQVLRFFNIRYLVVRPEKPGYLNDPATVIPYIESVLPVEVVSRNPDLILYRVNLPPPPDQVSLLADSTLLPLYFAEGWGLSGETITAQRKRVGLLVPLNGKAQLAQFTVDRYTSSPVSMRLLLNGWQSPPVEIPATPQTISFTIPAGVSTNGLNQIYLLFDHLAAVDNPTHLTVSSAGEEAGNWGHIYLNGIDVSPNQRGYNVAIIGANGRLLSAVNFDTHLDPNASSALAVVIAAAPTDATIAVAVADEAGNALTAEAVNALKSIGGQVDLRGQFRAAHVLIGSKDGRPARESFSLLQTAAVTTDDGLTEPRAAARFKQIIFTTVK